MKNGNRQSETRNASVLPYTYSPAGSNWLYQKGSDIRSKTLNGNTARVVSILRPFKEAIWAKPD